MTDFSRYRWPELIETLVEVYYKDYDEIRPSRGRLGLFVSKLEKAIRRQSEGFSSQLFDSSYRRNFLREIRLEVLRRLTGLSLSSSKELSLALLNALDDVVWQGEENLNPKVQELIKELAFQYISRNSSESCT